MAHARQLKHAEKERGRVGEGERLNAKATKINFTFNSCAIVKNFI